MADRWRLAERRLYLCTPDRPDLDLFIAACISGGVDIVQLRDKRLDAKPLLARAKLAQNVCAGLGVPFILNDRPDLALECEADGVHVGQDDAPPSLCRRILGADAIVGHSTHAPAQLRAAGQEPVDYVSAGPVIETPTKPGRPGVGLDYVRHAAEHATVPFWATGGMTPDSVRPVIETGARHIVAVRFLTESTDPARSARELRDAIDRAIAATTA